MIRITVDADRCTGHGRCYVLSPSVYSPDDEGYNASKGATIDVPEDLTRDAMIGVQACPERALAVLDAATP